jgi:hypothetical protein
MPLVSIESVAKKVQLHPRNELEMSEYGTWRMLCLWNVGSNYLSLSKPRDSTFAATSRENRCDGTKLNFVAIHQRNVGNGNVIDHCPVC